MSATEAGARVVQGSYTSPYKLFGIIALLLSTGSAALLYLGLSWNLLLSWLISVNVVTFLFYGYDKGRAQGGGLRVPEKVLHGLVLIGGCVGGLGGMFLFHHKTSKSSFQRVFWAIVLLEIAGVVAWLVM
ncbi:DUF1294 domain-containing protein [Chloroflexota bacterium]